MHEFTFADVACPPRHVVLNLPLLDFTLGHRILLSRARNPLLGLDEAHFNALPMQRQIAALIEAAFTCAQSYAENRALESPHCPLFKRLRLTLQVKLWHWTRRRSEKRWQNQATDTGEPAPGSYWSVEIAHFRNYLAASRINTDAEDLTSDIRSPTSGPRMPCLGPEKPVTDGSPTRRFGAPYDATLVQFLLQNGLCRSEAECMDYPFGLAEAHYLTHLEKEGCLRILNATEWTFADDCARLDHEAAIAAGFRNAKEHFDHVLAAARAKKAEFGKRNSESPPPAGLVATIPEELKP